MVLPYADTMKPKSPFTTLIINSGYAFGELL